jgi:hypothetical protein
LAAEVRGFLAAAETGGRSHNFTIFDHDSGKIHWQFLTFKLPLSLFNDTGTLLIIIAEIL